MRAASQLMTATWVIALSVACSEYELRSVQPTALAQSTIYKEAYSRVPKPKIMFLVDKSGSMNQPNDPSLPACTKDGRICGSDSFPCDVPQCPTRWSEMQRAMSAFLAEHGDVGPMGLLLYPKPKAMGCVNPELTAEGGLREALQTTKEEKDDAFRSAAWRIAQSLGETAPGGGTPTGASLQLLATYQPLVEVDGRDSAVVLLTDGLPNCNDANPASGDVPGSGCVCTTTSCQSSPGSSTSAARTGCLDQGGAVSGVRALRAKNVRTAVIGYGSEVNGSTSSTAKLVLNAMAEEGLLSRACDAQGSCGPNDTCLSTTGLCERKYHQAKTSAELLTALDEIRRQLPTGDACLLKLGAPLSDPELVSVFVNDALQPVSTWQYEEPGQVRLVGSLCERIRNATEADALNLELRAVQLL